MAFHGFGTLARMAQLDKPARRSCNRLQVFPHLRSVWESTAMIMPPDHPTRRATLRTAAAPADARVLFLDQLFDGLPLARAVLTLSDYVLQGPFLNELFAQHRGRCYEDLLTFPQLVHLVFDALRQHRGSGRKALRRAEEQQRLPTCREAFYGKLRRLPLSLSLAVLAATSARLRTVLPPLLAEPLPASLGRLDVLVLDGKKLKRVAKRLLACRGAAGKLSGGKLLVAWRPREGLVVGMAAHSDGEVNEARLVPDVLQQVQPHSSGPRLFVADRQFCDLVQTARFTTDGDHFLVRYHPKVHFHADATRPARTGADRQDRVVVEQWGWLGAETNPQRRYVRLLTLQRPGEEDILLVTDLLDAAAYPAADLLDTYLIRWGIERVFQQITEVFTLEQWIGTSPQATIFQASLCFLLYNLIQVVKGYVAQGARPVQKVTQVSAELLFESVREQLTALTVLAQPEEVVQTLVVVSSAQELVALLQSWLDGQWRPAWEKAHAGKSQPRKAKGRQSGAHTSVHRLQEKHKQKRQRQASVDT
jgi:Transposase DDE domain